MLTTTKPLGRLTIDPTYCHFFLVCNFSGRGMSKSRSHEADLIEKDILL